jgi:uncharacterized tellurite resistance protein B-like protein
MIGFFEHQYLTYKKNHIRNLLALAKVDGHVHQKEEKLLFKIGKRYGLKERQVKELIESKEKFKMNVPDNHNDRMNLLYDLLLMIYADAKVDKHEIEFFEEAMKKLGMKKEMAKWLLKEFESGPPSKGEEWEEIKAEALNKYILKP